jgi:hypothetical protein
VVALARSAVAADATATVAPVPCALILTYSPMGLSCWHSEHTREVGVTEGRDIAELQVRTEHMEHALRQARLAFQRVDRATLPLLRTLTWDPKASEARPAPEDMQQARSRSWPTAGSTPERSSSTPRSLIARTEP